MKHGRPDNNEKLTESSSDYQRESISRRIKDAAWKFANMLAMPLDIHQVSDHGKVGKKLFSLGPLETKYLPHSMFKGHENICAMYSTNRGSFIALEPYTLRSHLKDIKLGTVTYDEYGDTDYHNSQADLPSVRIYNSLPMAIDVYYSPREKYRNEHPVKKGHSGYKGSPLETWGTLVAQVNGRELVDYKGGGDSSVYFNNNYDGLRLRDEFTFAYKPTKSSTPIKLCTVEVKDTYMKNMYVGKIAAIGAMYVDDDVYGYSVDYEDSTGFPFYPAPGGTYSSYNSQTRRVIVPGNAIQRDPLMFGANPYDTRAVNFDLTLPPSGSW